MVGVFKSQDARALESAFGEYAKAMLPREKTGKPLLRDQLDKFMALAKAIASPARNRSRGGHEL